jgi:hypothetical protein
MSDIQKCKDTIVKEFTNDIINNLKKLFSKSKYLDSKQKKEQIAKIEDPKSKATLESNLKKYYCNKECKGTILEKGEPDKLPTELLKMINKKIAKKGSPEYDGIVKLIINQRKEIFKNKNDVLVDSFYEKLPKKDIDKMKQKNAVSGCVVISPYNKTISKKTMKKFKSVTKKVKKLYGSKSKK